MSSLIDSSSAPANGASLALGATETATALATLTQLEQQLPLLISLTLDARARLARMGDRKQAFVDDALAVALANPGLVPRSVDLVQLDGTVETLRNLGVIRRKLEYVLTKVGDTEGQLLTDSFGIARAVYAVMKSPVTVTGLTDQQNRLGQRFARKTRRPADSVPPTGPAMAA